MVVERARTDPEAFGVLYDRYLNRVYSYFYHHTGGNVHDSEDLTEKVFFQVMTHLSSYTNRGLPFGAWVFRIAHNIMANWHRDRARHPQAPLDDYDVGSDFEDPMEVIEEQAMVRKLVANLADNPKRVLLLKFVQGFSNAEIGQAMGKTEGAVKALLHRTLKKMREELTSRQP
ncbi:MAG: sigma-70 family RNA polymerase sigma factor [Chloroflexi bacterium]|nr:sigma-70 family RNA polymerase sigma factor [Chloroflexota bacterium]